MVRTVEEFLQEKMGEGWNIDMVFRLRDGSPCYKGFARKTLTSDNIQEFINIECTAIKGRFGNSFLELLIDMFPEVMNYQIPDKDEVEENILKWVNDYDFSVECKGKGRGYELTYEGHGTRADLDLTKPETFTEAIMNQKHGFSKTFNGLLYNMFVNEDYIGMDNE